MTRILRCCFEYFSSFILLSSTMFLIPILFICFSPKLKCLFFFFFFLRGLVKKQKLKSLTWINFTFWPKNWIFEQKKKKTLKKEPNYSNSKIQPKLTPPHCQINMKKFSQKKRKKKKRVQIKIPSTKRTRE